MISAVTAGTQQATLTWNTPANNGSAITGYVVTPYIGSVAQAPQTFAGSGTTAIAAMNCGRNWICIERDPDYAAKLGVDTDALIDYVTAQGFTFMDTPGYDPAAVTGQVAGGCNVVCFTTGRGSVSGWKPAPTIKIATNTAMYEHMREDMDINCGDIARGTDTSSIVLANSPPCGISLTPTLLMLKLPVAIGAPSSRRVAR